MVVIHVITFIFGERSVSLGVIISDLFDTC